jgi:hypothetical protein
MNVMLFLSTHASLYPPSTLFYDFTPLTDDRSASSVCKPENISDTCGSHILLDIDEESLDSFSYFSENNAFDRTLIHDIASSVRPSFICSLWEYEDLELHIEVPIDGVGFTDA